MTDETKKAFTAPWHSNLKEDYVEDAKGFVIAKCLSNPITNCFSHLPELYDALMDVAVQIYPDAFLANDKCRLCFKAQCKGREIVELLRKVRDGE